MKQQATPAGNPAMSQRALRKQLMLMRAATERAEMVQALESARQSTAALRHGVPGLALDKGLPLALGLLKSASVLSPLLSLVLSGARRPLLRYALLGAGSALLAWKGYQWVAERPAPAAAPAEGDEHAV